MVTFKELKEMLADKTWVSCSCSNGYHDWCFVFYDHIKVCHCSCHDDDGFDTIRERNAHLIAELRKPD